MRVNNELCIAFIDVDNFKKINDCYSHAGGDAVLRSLGINVRTTLRKSDLVGRFGGEEFVIVLPETGVENAKEPLINCLRRRITALVGARKLTCLIDMSRFLRSVRLALHPARIINQRFPKKVMEKIRILLSNDCVDGAENTIRYTVSIGLAVYNSSNHTDLDKLMARADGALYQAKKSGKNCIVVADVIEAKPNGQLQPCQT